MSTASIKDCRNLKKNSSAVELDFLKNTSGSAQKMRYLQRSEKDCDNEKSVPIRMNSLFFLKIQVHHHN